VGGLRPSWPVTASSSKAATGSLLPLTSTTPRGRKNGVGASTFARCAHEDVRAQRFVRTLRPRRDINLIARHGVVEVPHRAQVADHHAPHVDADAHFQTGPTFGTPARVQRERVQALSRQFLHNLPEQPPIATDEPLTPRYREREDRHVNRRIAWAVPSRRWSDVANTWTVKRCVAGSCPMAKASRRVLPNPPTTECRLRTIRGISRLHSLSYPVAECVLSASPRFSFFDAVIRARG